MEGGMNCPVEVAGVDMLLAPNHDDNMVDDAH